MLLTISSQSIQLLFKIFFCIIKSLYFYIFSYIQIIYFYFVNNILVD